MAEQLPPSDSPGTDVNGSYSALTSGIVRYLECLEDFFPYAATKLSLNQHKEHAADAERYSLEELESERVQLQQQLQGPIPRAIRGSALVVLYSAFESTVMDFSRELSGDLKCSRFEPRSKPSFPEQAEQHFRNAFKVDLFSGRTEKQGVDQLRLLRNSFIHNQSSFQHLPRQLQKGIHKPQTALTHCLLNEDIWIPTARCIKAHGGLIRGWGQMLSQRVIGRVGFDRYL
jgi:hypothetical protein